MANPEHLEILKQGSAVWNKWRVAYPEIRTEISGPYPFIAELRGANLSGTQLRGADLSGADLSDADLSSADLSNSNLSGANLSSANLSSANINATDMSYASLLGTNLGGANLSGANLYSTDMRYVNFLGARLSGTNFNNASLSGAIFASVNLGEVEGLETVKHLGPSEISIKTLYLSEGRIPEVFLRNCGAPDDFITFLPHIIEGSQPIKFHSCFISYSHEDVDFARYLCSRMKDTQLRVWYAPEEMKGGRKIHEQIFRAIRLYDKMLVVLSEHSLQSGWVTTEIRRARKAESEEGRRKLFPIRLVDIEAIKKWECFDADSGEDLAVEVREYFIPDFSIWKNDDAFEAAFDGLLRDLRAEEEKA
jgi:hypothetical protein